MSKLRIHFFQSNEISSQDLMNLIDPKTVSNPLQYILVIFSTLFMCIGINFNSYTVSLLSMALNPMLLSVITMSLGLSTFDISITQRGIQKIIIQSSIMILVSMIYFALTPVYIQPKTLITFSDIQLSHIAIGFLMGILSIFVLKLDYRAILFSFFAIAINWIPALCCVGYGLVFQDWIILKGALNLFWLNVFFVFIGSFISIQFLSVKSNAEQTKVSIYLMKLLLFLILTFGCYYGFRTNLYLIKKSNIESYLYQGLNSKTFTINSYERNPLTNEVTVYYNGIKSPASQDEVLKKKFKVNSLNFNFQSI